MATELEQRMYDDLSKALWWLENLATAHGEAALLDNMPNNWAGRGAITETLRNAEREHPELVDLMPGTFVTDEDRLIYGSDWPVSATSMRPRSAPWPAWPVVWPPRPFSATTPMRRWPTSGRRFSRQRCSSSLSRTPRLTALRPHHSNQVWSNSERKGTK